MDGVQAITVAHRGEIRHVLVYPGLSPHELSKLLTTAFGLGDHTAVVGFLDQQSVIVPISLACSSTQQRSGGAGVLLSPGGTYQLLLTHEQSQPQSPVGVIPASSSASTVPTLPVGTPRPPAADRAPSPHEEQWQEPLARFLHALAGQGVLTSEEHAALQPLVDDGHFALAAAYRVAAARGGNRELLAAMCKRVAQGAGQGQEGESLLEAQAEMLRMLGHMLEEGLVTPTQHTQLECLVLLRHETIFDAFNSYTRTGDADRFCDDLADLGDRGEALIAEPLGQASPSPSPPPPPQQPPPPAQQPSPVPGAVRPFLEVVRSMGIRPAFQEYLLRQLRGGDEYVLGAYEVYELDKDEAEFVDSLRRILKVRMEARRLELGKYLQQQQQELRDRILQQQRERQRRLTHHHGGSGRARSLSLPTAPDQQALPLPPPVISSSSPTVLSDHPPPLQQDFATAVHALARTGRLPPAAAALLVQLHARGHEALRAAWDKYCRHGDEAGLVDACARVARVAMAAAAAGAAGGGEAGGIVEEEPEVVLMPPPAPRPKAAAGREAATPAADGSGAARRARTRTAILTQSLDLMVSRGTLDLRGYRALARRLQAGDVALLGALDAFVEDRDVDALLRRLGVLARPHPPINGNGNGGSDAQGGRLPLPPSVPINGGGLRQQQEQQREEEEGEEEETATLATDQAVRLPPPTTDRTVLTQEDEDGDQSTIATALTPTAPIGRQQKGEEGEALELEEGDREELLEILMSTGCLTEEERALLGGAAARGEQALMGVFAAFARTQDVGRFQRSLRKYALILKATRPLMQQQAPALLVHSPVGARPRGLSDLTMEGEEELLQPPAPVSKTVAGANAGMGRSEEEEEGVVTQRLDSLSLAGAERDMKSRDTASGHQLQQHDGFVGMKARRLQEETAAMLQGLQRQHHQEQQR